MRKRRALKAELLNAPASVRGFALVETLRTFIVISLGVVWSLFIIDFLLVFLYGMWLSPLYFRFRKAFSKKKEFAA